MDDFRRFGLKSSAADASLGAMVSSRLVAWLVSCALIALFTPSASAQTLGPVQPLAAPPGAAQRAPQVAFGPGACEDAQNNNIDCYVVVWEEDRQGASGFDLYLARIAVDGSPIDQTAVTVVAAGGDQSQSTITYNPNALAFMLAWIDPNGLNDLVVDRFRADLGVFNGAVQLTNDNRIETRPSLGCSTQGCLVAFLQTQGGTTQLSGWRLANNTDPVDVTELDLVTNNTGATTESVPRVLPSGANFIVAWADDRNAGTTGLDLFARSVTWVGANAAVAGTSLVTANFRQDSISLAPIGSIGNFIAGWDDQRNAASASPTETSVRANLFTSSLAPTGAGERVINDATDDQRFPILATKAGAGAAGGGLAVWQDRRSGSIGIIYGSRINDAGAVLDPNGLPLLAFPANAFDHSAARGPNADTIVFAVRAAPEPDAIFYRIFRNEPPAGGMNLDTNASTTDADADGVDTAFVLFEPTAGAYQPGFILADGALYTVTVSNPAVVITPPDADPNRAGHQVGTFDGNIGLTLSSLDPDLVTVSIASVEGASTGSTMVTFFNVPPVATNALIAPAQPSSAEDLTLSYSYTDINGDPEQLTQITWTRNSAAVAGLQDQRTVPNGQTSRGDVWQASVRPHDGSNFGAVVFTPDVTVGNSPPLALDVRIVPDTGVKVATALSARYTFQDPDRDAESDTVLRWFEGGTEQADLLDQSDVPGARVFKGQAWSFSVTPSDGTDPGPTVTSPVVDVENSQPVADAGLRAAVTERRSITLDGTGSLDADPSDTLTYLWEQTDGLSVNLTDTSSPTPSFEAPSVTSTQFLVFGLTVNDGEIDSALDTVTVEIRAVPDGDADGLDDEEEAEIGTDPTRADTDRDSLNDGEEVRLGTDPFDPDSDDDGLRDGAEAMPGEDTDLDGLINALDPDSDNDGILDGTEAGVTEPIDGTDINAGNFVPDADRDTMTDAADADSDDDGLADGEEDTNHNGRVDLGESDPNDPTSVVGCSPDGSCPAGQVCERNACRGAAVDGGMMCQPLAAQGIECCMGGCRDGTLVTPQCRASGAMEQCPSGAMQCATGSCSMNDPNGSDGGDGGCGCSAAGSSSEGAWFAWLGLGALFLARRRRR